MTRATPLLAALALVTACSGDGDAGGDQLALTVNREGWNEIWLMAADGSDRRRLTETEPPENDAAGSVGPAWSSDGTQIAFAAQTGTTEERQEGTEIYVMDADGGAVRRLTTNDVLDAGPTWSPDGTRIAFTRIGSGPAQARGGLFVLDLESGRETRLTSRRWPDLDVGAAWSPDGTMLAFARLSRSAGSLQGRSEIVVLELDSGELRTVTSDGVEPDWSPDGSRLAFTSYRDRNGQTCFHECGPSGEIYVVDVDGGNETRLTESEAADQSPAWSPDGNSLAFVSDRADPEEHAYEIYRMDTDGTDVRRLTDNGVWDLEPAWRP